MLTRNRVIYGLVGLMTLVLSHSGHAGAASSSMLKLGEESFNENCAVCHQADAIGQPGVAPSLTNPELLSVSSDKFLMATIRDGREDTGMPPFAHLGRTNVRAIVAFLRSHAKIPNRAEAVAAHPAAPGDPPPGQQWYHHVLPTPHALSGHACQAGAPGPPTAPSGFLDKVSDGFIRETIKKGRSNTRMLSFQGPAGLANLSDQEIDDIIVYLRSLAQD